MGITVISISAELTLETLILVERSFTLFERWLTSCCKDEIVSLCKEAKSSSCVQVESMSSSFFIIIRYT